MFYTSSINSNKAKKILIFIIPILMIFGSFTSLFIKNSTENYIIINGQQYCIEELKLIPDGWQLDAQSRSSPQRPATGAGSASGGDAQGGASQTIISGVPAYEWRRGCGPTSVGMVIGYYDSHGFDDLVTGDASYQSTYVNDMISSSENWYDYCLPLDEPPNLKNDKSQPPIYDEHDDNCVADFMKTSQSYYDNYYGWSHFSHADNAFTGYVNYKAPHYSTSASLKHWGVLNWNTYKSEIDANRPVVFLVDTDGNDETDHFVTAIGYDSNYNYACYDTWDSSIHWYDFSQMSFGNLWGIYGAVFYSISSAAQLSYTPNSHDFGNMVEGGTDSTTFEIWNSGSSTLSYSFSENCDWLTVTPLTGSSNGEHDIITINVDTTDLPIGYYEYPLTINSNGGDGTFIVSLTVYAPYPLLLYNPSNYDCGTMVAGETDSTTFEIWNGGTNTLTYSISESESWCTVSPTSGSSNGEHDTISINVDTTGLSVGSYQCPITINSNGGSGVFNVYLFIDIPGGSQEEDQTQTSFNEGLNIYQGRYGAQSFSPSLDTLTKVQIHITKTGNPTSDFTVAIKDDFDGDDLTARTLLSNEIPSSGWVTFDFSDISVIPGEVYYIIARSSDMMWSHCYNWDYVNYNAYPYGFFYRSLNYGDSWNKYSDQDFTFKTYGLAQGAPTAVLSYSPTQYDFGTLQQGQTDTTTFQIWNSGTGTLTYSLSEPCDWVSISPTSGSSNGEHDTINIDIVTTNLEAGSHQCTININSDGGNGAFNVFVEIEGNSDTPQLAYDPTEFDFGDKSQGQQDSTTFEIWNSGTGTLTYSLTESSDWIYLDTSSGNSNGEHDIITIDIDTTGLLPGSYQSDISISSNDGSGIFTVYVNIIDPSQPVLSFDPTEHDFGDKNEGQFDTTIFDIWNSGTGTLSYNLAETCSWLSINPNTGTSTGEHDQIEINIDTTGLTAGSYQCDISITSNGGSGTFTVYVTILQPDNPTLSINPGEYDFGNKEEGASDSTSFEIWNSQTGTLTYTLTESCSWVTTNPSFGESTGEHDTITVNLDTTGLNTGNHQCTISITSNGGTDSFDVFVYITSPDEGEQLDQQQTQSNSEFNIYLSRQGAQSFKPTLPTLTKVVLYMSKTGTPPNAITVSIRQELNGQDLTSVSKSANQISTNYNWVEFDFSDIQVNPGNTYYIVAQTTSGMWTHCYNWRNIETNQYSNGDYYRTLNYGSSWSKYSSYDYAFKTYGSSQGPIFYSITINVNGQGTVIKNPDQTSYTPGTVVSLTANPDAGWSFSHWSGDLTGSINPESINMNSHKTITANFIQSGFSLTINYIGDGTVSKNPNQATYPPGTYVELTANPSTGWEFSHWSEDLSGSINPISIQMNEDKIIIANFNQANSNDQLDQQQSQQNSDFAIYLSRHGAQSFTPSFPILTKVEIYLTTTGNPLEPLTVSIRQTLMGDDLSATSLQPGQINSGWNTFNFADISVNPGQEYFIIVQTQNGMWAHCYNWRFTDSNSYSDGEFYRSLNYGDSWTKYSNYDYAFRTFGMN